MSADLSLPVTQPKINCIKQTIDQLKEATQVIAGTPKVLSLVWRAHKGYTLLNLVINLVLGLTPLSEIWITKCIVDLIAAYMRQPDPTQIVPKVMLLLVLLGLTRLINDAVEPTRTFAQQQLGEALTRDINTLIFKKANSFVDISVFENPNFYDMLQRAQNEASYRPLSILSNLTTILRSTINLVSMVVVLVLFQPFLAILIVALSTPHLIVQLRHFKEGWALQSYEIPEVRRMNYIGHVLTSNTDAKEVRLFGLGDFFLSLYLKKFKEFQDGHAKMRAAHWRNNVLLAVLSASGIACSYAFIVIKAVFGAISLGSMTLYLSAVTQIEYGLQSIVWSMSMLYEGNLFAKNLFEFLDLPLKMQVPPPDLAIKAPCRLKQGITFENVEFSYPDKSQKVLDGVSFTLRPGQSVALVGENGAGKTTLVKLLSRLHDPTGGRILVDGTDLKQYEINSWRAKIGVIFQDFCRFHMTAKENIGIGKVSSIEDLLAVQVAARRGNAADVIAKLEDGYDTTLGRYYSAKDKGAELSGGEWQKIGLARAFMRSAESSAADSAESAADGDEFEAQLLILDEPTAALDAKAEYDVYLRFHELTRGKTTLLISHRFSTVKMADLILVLENGKITEQGNHKELMALAGEYARLFNLQADRYKDSQN